ncbi:MAG: PBP1A family penicillin-binding protein [Acidobacteriia bacterium]|nr:PBP1A family penicillin-binding protein [Terriglobia bacterium]
MMRLRIRLPERLSAFLWKNSKILIASAIVLVLLIIGPLIYYFFKFSRIIDQRFSGEVFARTSQIYAAPTLIYDGEASRPSDITTDLRRAGYVEQGKGSSQKGEFQYARTGLQIIPGPDSGLDPNTAHVRVEFQEGRISHITQVNNGVEVASAELEPELVTNLFDQRREKRRLLKYEDIPPMLVAAVLSAEDKRFFSHSGFDVLRTLSSAFHDVSRLEKAQGGSTITQQVARSFFLTPTKTWRRKVAELYIALLLERKLTKQDIFDLYANQEYLGQRGSFSINGFGEAAVAYFNKDIKNLSLAEVATLAGIIQSPNRFSPWRHPDRALARRNWVLGQMQENGYITEPQKETALKTTLVVVPPNYDYGEAPYFVDLVKDQLLDKYSETDLITQQFKIYTTLDLALQRAAYESVRDGMKQVDDYVAQRGRRKLKKGQPPPKLGFNDLPQAALVALDPHTGEIKALIGGTDYGLSQLNRVLAKRPPGSAFKPFVYATALNSGVDGAQPLITPVTTVVDEPTTFTFDDKTYSPDNFGQQFYGTVSVRTALAHSLNVATIKIAEMAGLQRVVDLAISAGLNNRIKATPSMAIGAYEVTPLELSGAYTTFANGGVRVDPYMISSIRNQSGAEMEHAQLKTKWVLDRRTTYLVTHLLENVINTGTAAGVRARGFGLPAAGKTGTSHDAWFAGYTSGLLCIVWVGFDDNRDIKIEGAKAALPIWTEFMLKAAKLRPRTIGGQPFSPPDGIEFAKIDPESGELANDGCPATIDEAFIAGTAPLQHCHLHGGGFMQRMFGTFGKPVVQPPPPNP